MKRYFLLSLLLTAFTAGIQAQANAEINFTEDKHSFGEIEEGPKVSHEFNFVNTGKEPLILSNVKASCGCTTPAWTKEPVLPGEKGTILVTYNTSRRPGSFNKSITVTSNATAASKILYISGNVIALVEEETMPIKQPLMMAPAN
jgi:hypothetical protein